MADAAAVQQLTKGWHEALVVKAMVVSCPPVGDCTLEEAMGRKKVLVSFGN